VKNAFRKTLSRWVEAGRKVGFLLVLVAGSAALGLLISWPLWLFATSARAAYSITVLGLAGAGIVYLIFRSIRRSRTTTRDPGKPRRTFLSVLLTVLMVLVGFSGAYLAAAFLARGLWIFGAADLAALGLLQWALGRARISAKRGSAKNRKVRPVPAENGSE
jgi:hypothetical protein